MEFAYEDPIRKNGLFTHSILKTIEDATAGQIAKLSASNLAVNVSSMVERLTHGLQNPRARFMNLTTNFPVLVANEYGPPDLPQQVVIHYLKWSSRANEPVHPRLMTCFAPVVSYYGKTMDLEEILREENAYAQRFRIRDNKAKRISVGPPDGAGVFRVELELDFQHSTDMDVCEADEILRRIANGEETGWQDASGHCSDENGKVIKRMLKRVGTVTVVACVRQFAHEWRIMRIEHATQDEQRFV